MRFVQYLEKYTNIYASLIGSLNTHSNIRTQHKSNAIEFIACVEGISNSEDFILRNLDLSALSITLRRSIRYFSSYSEYR